MTKLARFFTLLLMGVAACAPRNAAAPVMPLPSPTADALLPLLVEHAVSAALTQTAQAIPPTSQAIPPTLQAIPPTAEPSATSAPAATVTPLSNFTPAATESASAEISLTIQADGAAFYVDSLSGFSVLIPAEWLAVRPAQTEFYQALEFHQTADPLMYAALQTAQGADPAILRLFAVHTQFEMTENEPAVTLRFEWDSARARDVSSLDALDLLSDEWTAAVPGLMVTALDVVANPAGLRLGALEAETSSSNGLRIYKRVYFNAKNGDMQVTLTTPERFKLDVLPAFDAIMDTVTISP